MPPPPAQVTVSTKLHSQVLLPARVANAADGDGGNGEGRLRTATDRQTAPTLGSGLHGGRDIAIDRPAETTALLTFSCTGCTSKVVVETDNDLPVNDIGGSELRRLRLSGASVIKSGAGSTGGVSCRTSQEDGYAPFGNDPLAAGY